MIRELVATGRRPNTDGLNAAEAGVELTPRGAVKVDEKLRTTAAEALPQTRRLGMGLALTSGALIVITLI